jgi:hypothetical protein
VTQKAYFAITAFDGLGNGVITLRQVNDSGRKGFWVLGRPAALSVRVRSLRIVGGDFNNVNYHSNSLASTAVTPNTLASGDGHVLAGHVGNTDWTTMFGTDNAPIAGVDGAAEDSLSGTHSWLHSATLWLREAP